MENRLILRRLLPGELRVPEVGIGRTFGLLQMGPITLRTLEREWIPGPHGCGAPNVSCLPAGEYELVWRESPSKGMRLHFRNEDLGVYVESHYREHPWQRFSCMFHPANYASDLAGCIAVGETFQDFGGKGFGVGRSTLATRALEAYVREHGITTLEIRE